MSTIYLQPALYIHRNDDAYPERFHDALCYMDVSAWEHGWLAKNDSRETRPLTEQELQQLPTHLPYVIDRVLAIYGPNTTVVFTPTLFIPHPNEN